MSRRPCQRFGDTLTGFVDGVLPDADRERVLTHLVDCTHCRAEVAELRAVRDLLGSRPRHGADTPADLSHRLLSIAGSEAADPLWSRPFTPHGPARPYALPSRRRRVRTRVATAVLVVGFLGAGASGAGYLAAPPPPTEIGDPGAGAEAEFSNALAQAPLTSDAVNAVIMDSGATTPGRDRVPTPTPAPDSGSGARRPATAHLGEAASTTLLAKADRAGRTLAHDGIQQVSLWQDGRETSARVQIEARPGQGSQVAVLDPDGDAHRAGFIARTALQTGSFDRLAERYALSGAEGGEVAGRQATMVQAVSDGQVRARWWLDTDTGLMLWSETYDEAGRALQSSGYVSVEISAAEDAFLTHLAPRLSVSGTTSALSSGRAAELAGRGWGCAESVAGLPLVQVRGDDFGDPGMLRSTYSDGVHTLSVLQRRGVLGASPAGFEWDPALSAYRNSEVPAVATWQSGDTVVTVITDGSARVLAAAIDDLPHDPPPGQGGMHRVVAGWEHILRSMVQIR
ncbi:MAG: sigma-E factor regulatory protein RseB domain-containing protein [Propionibacteriaceae bacterium]